MPRHKHADVIIAWANGEEVEVDYDDGWGWQDLKSLSGLYLEAKYRIKPKIVKKEGWVVRRRDPAFIGGYAVRNTIYETESECRNNNPSAISFHRIEWEEEV